MRGIYIIEYSVKGIKSLENWTSLSFYKKSITKSFSINGYNIKGIYGGNGAGKSALILSVHIMKELLQDSSYLHNPVTQQRLDALINKKLESLEIRVGYLVRSKFSFKLYHYEVKLEKNKSNNRYVITKEKLTAENAVSHSGKEETLFCVEQGNLVVPDVSTATDTDGFLISMVEQTKNLLQGATLLATFLERSMSLKAGSTASKQLRMGLVSLFLFEESVFVYLASSDKHTSFLLNNMLLHTLKGEKEGDKGEIDLNYLINEIFLLLERKSYELSENTIIIKRDQFDGFKAEVSRLFEFLRIFKEDLSGITIERKEAGDVLNCNLIFNYQGYSVNAEFESTGIRKLIQLYEFFQNMVSGNIVFVDELDANLHDVYLCALLEYLMEYGKGQLCFSTHNVGPMDVLKRGKMSIDFLSADNRISSWSANGNYSPSKLYRKGMIEGSPFNVFPFDFIGAFKTEEDE